jgi:hypothetical protein
MFEILVFRVEVIKWPPLVFPVTLATDETAKGMATSEAATQEIKKLIEQQKRLRAAKAVAVAKEEEEEETFQDTAVVEDAVKEEEEETPVAAKEEEETPVAVKEEWLPSSSKAPPKKRDLSGLKKIGGPPAKARKKIGGPPAKARMVLKSKAAPVASGSRPKARGSVAAQLPDAGLGLKIVFSIVYILNESLMFSPSRVFNA